MKFLLKTSLFILLCFLVSCSSTGYGLLAIESPSGKKLYFRREVRGLNYDLLSLSEKNNYCSKPDPQTSLIFRTIDPHAFYKFNENELHIYTMADVTKPTKLADGIELVVHAIGNQQYIHMKEDYLEMGLQRVEVPIYHSNWCF